MKTSRKPKFADPSGRRYPYLGVFDDGEANFVILFTDTGTGTVVDIDESEYWSVGTYKKTWDESDFDFYYGDITLTQ